MESTVRLGLKTSLTQHKMLAYLTALCDVLRQQAAGADGRKRLRGGLRAVAALSERLHLAAVLQRAGVLEEAAEAAGEDGWAAGEGDRATPPLI